MRVCLGGTFEPLHAGHRALLAAAAADATEIFVGITDGPLAHRPDRPISPWSHRAAAVESTLRALGYKGNVTTRALPDGIGPAATGDYDAIVVSPETLRGAERINEDRVKAGRKRLQVRIVPHTLGQDLLPISATAIHAGRIDPDGRRLTPVQVAVGSGNDVKVRAVLEEFVRLVAVPADVRGFAVASGVPEQPKGDETLRGARARAEAALASWPGCDYAVGIEAGLVRMPGATALVDAQACCVIDRTGWATEGWGPGFEYPGWVTREAERGRMVSELLGPLANDARIGSTTGAIGWLTDGRLDRTELSRLAVLMAFVPRLQRGLYTMPK